jgi:hypothetical protein
MGSQGGCGALASLPYYQARPDLVIRDASYPLLPYLTRPTASSTLEFDPVCSLFRGESDPRGITLLELGSGQSLASLHLALQLATTDLIVLTDLPEVMTLCEKNASEKLKGYQAAQVLAQGLAWGDEESVALLAESVEGRGGLTHVLLCDLVYQTRGADRG